jgi:hypothetical protein
LVAVSRYLIEALVVGELSDLFAIHNPHFDLISSSNQWGGKTMTVSSIKSSQGLPLYWRHGIISRVLLLLETPHCDV